MRSLIRWITTTLLITTMAACSGGGGGGGAGTSPSGATPGTTNDTGVAGTAPPSAETPSATEKQPATGTSSDTASGAASGGTTPQKPATDGIANSPGGDGGAQVPGVINDVSGLTIGSDITVDFKDTNYVSFSWGPAKDTTTPEADLQYKVIIANKPDAIDTVTEANAITDKGLIINWQAASEWNGKLKAFASQTPDGSKLTPGATYYVTVLVRDADNNMALYPPQPIATAPLASSPSFGGILTFSQVAQTSVTISWGAAQDDITPVDKLQYKLVSASSPDLIDSIAKVEGITGSDLSMDWTPNALSKAVNNLAPGKKYYFAVLVKDSDDNKTLGNRMPIVTQAGKKVYITQATFSPNLGSIAEADKKCMSDASYPGSGIYKAMIVDGETRIACTSSNCSTNGATEHKDWVFAANTLYERPYDSVVVGITNDKGIFDFPLQAKFYDIGLTWTGLSTDWTTSASTCKKWTSSASGDIGVFGSYTTSVGAISFGTMECYKVMPELLCVEQ